MWHQKLLMDVIAGDDVLRKVPVVEDFARVLSPCILRQFADRPALGGAGVPLPDQGTTGLPAGAKPMNAKVRARLGRLYPDQSLASHLINGAFAGFRLGGLFPDVLAWDTERWRIWTLGFMLHDAGKARAVEISPAHLNDARTLCRELGEQLAFDEFFRDWRDSLGDILFVAQNTQKARGSFLSVPDFDTRLGPYYLQPLRLLASFADVLVHVTEPRDVAAPSADGRSRHTNLQETLKSLFPSGRVPRLAYHQLAEVRGLITNQIHNALQRVFASHGYKPYLYFANGIVYIAPAGDAIAIDLPEVTARAWNEIVKAFTKEPDFGLDRDGKGIKVAPPMYEFLDAAGLAEAGKHYAVARISNAVARKRLDKYAATTAGLADDVRVDRLAEFIVFLKRCVADQVLPRARDITDFLLAQLGLDGVVTAAEAERQQGGVPLGWFYVASRYVTQHADLSPTGVADVLGQLMAALLEELRAQGLPAHGPNILRGDFEMYLADVTDLDGSRYADGNPLASFGAELTRYTEGKASNRALCSLCSSAYVSSEQTETVVLFKPQQYSTKNRLGGSRVTRGICPICSLEMLLRQAVHGVTGGKVQEQKATYLTLYPAYFFTPEIAKLVSKCVERLTDLNLHLGSGSLLAKLRRANERGEMDLSALLDYEHFLAEDDDELKPKRSIRTPGYAPDELSGLVMLQLQPRDPKPTDTDAWILPAFYALALPLLLNVRTVASASFVPLFGSAAEFRRAAVLDGLHPAIRLALGDDEFHIDELKHILARLLAFYDLHTDVFAEGYDVHWGQLAAVVRDVLTDPYNVFAYYDRKKRTGTTRETTGTKRRAGANGGGASDGVSPWDQDKYMDIYRTLGSGHTREEGRKESGMAQEMGVVGELVDAYARFYRAQGDKLSSAYAVLKPLAMAIDVTVVSPLNIRDSDLVLTISGTLHDLMERVRDRQADGWDQVQSDHKAEPWGERMEISRRAIQDFAELFVSDLFQRYCYGERAVLRERANALRSAARFYYLSRYTPRAMARAGSAPGTASDTASNDESDKE